MTNSTVEAEIILLVQEIGQLEKKLDDAKSDVRTYKGWSQEERYVTKANAIEDKIHRKMQLLKILKG